MMESMRERLSDFKDYLIELFYSEPEKNTSYRTSRKYSLKLTGGDSPFPDRFAN